MEPHRSFRRTAWVAVFAALAGCTATTTTSPRLAQRHGGGGGTTCNQDSDCHVRVPAPRACPGGAVSTATACCRASYCGICWSDCPAAAPHATSSDAPPATL